MKIERTRIPFIQRRFHCRRRPRILRSLLYKVLYEEAPVQGPTPYPFASHTIQKWCPFEILTNCKSFCQYK